MWDLWLPEGSPRKTYLQYKYGFAQKWKKWLDNWDQLETRHSSVGIKSNSLTAG